MSKRIILSVCGLLLMMSQAATAAESMRIWDAASTGEGFAKFRAQLGQIGGVYQDGQLSAEKLALGACSMAVQQERHVSLEQCQADFRQLNGLPVASKFGDQADRVAYQQFAQVRDNSGWRLPLATVGSLPVNPAPVVAPAPAGVSLEELKAARLEAAAAAAANHSLSGKVASLQGKLSQATVGSAEAKAGIAALRREQSGLRADITTMQRGVDEVMSGVIGTAQTAQQTAEAAQKAAANATSAAGDAKSTANTVMGRFEQNRTLIYVLGGVIVVVIGFMIFGGRTQHKQGKRLTKVEAEVTGLKVEMAEAKERIAFVEGKENSAIRIAMGANETAREALEAVSETQDLVHKTADVALDVERNASIEALAALPVGPAHAVFWYGTVGSRRFVVKIWKDETTPAGSVETDIVRNAQSGQRANAMALKRLEQRIKTAALDGRVHLTPVAVSAAA